MASCWAPPPSAAAAPPLRRLPCPWKLLRLETLQPSTRTARKLRLQVCSALGPPTVAACMHLLHDVTLLALPRAVEPHRAMLLQYAGEE